MKCAIKIALLLVIMPLLFSCAINPVTGKTELMLLSEEGEISMGQETDPQIVAMYGVYNDWDLDAYVENLGDRMARISHRPNLNYEFKIMDSPAINALAPSLHAVRVAGSFSEGTRYSATAKGSGRLLTPGSPSIHSGLDAKAK